MFICVILDFQKARSGILTYLELSNPGYLEVHKYHYECLAVCCGDGLEWWTDVAS